MKCGKILIVCIAMLAAVGIVAMISFHPIANTDAKGAIDTVLGFLGGVITTGSHSIYTEAQPRPLEPK